MPQPTKKITVVFFRAGNGSEPVREWLRGLAREDRMKIGEDIRVVELGWPIGMPVSRPLGSGLYEVRTNLKDRIARVLFGIDSDDMILVHGFIKKTRATPADDLNTARKRLAQYKRRQ